MLFSVDAGVFWPFFGGCVGVLAHICLLGVLYELIRNGVVCKSAARFMDPGEKKDDS